MHFTAMFAPLNYTFMCRLVQARPCQQRWDHSLLHARQCHLLQTGSWVCPQLPGDDIHETNVLRQLLRICKKKQKISNKSNIDVLFFWLCLCKCKNNIKFVFCFCYLYVEMWTLFFSIFILTVVGCHQARLQMQRYVLHSTKLCHVYLWPHVSVVLEFHTEDRHKHCLWGVQVKWRYLRKV